MSQAPDAAWQPDGATVVHANLTQFIASRGLASFEDLHRWSVADPDGFWDEVIDKLSIQFAVPPTSARGSSDPTDPDWLPNALMNIITSCLDHDPNSVAIISDGPVGLDATTVGELSELVAAFAAGFEERGFSPGDAVAIVMPMNKEAVVAYLGIAAAGGVVVSIADSFAPDEIATRLSLTGAVAVVTQDRTQRLGQSLPMYEKCIEACAPQCIVVDTGAGTNRRDNDVEWVDFIVPGVEFDPIVRPAGAHTNILFSSGTTGEPKAIPWTQTTPIKAAMDGRYHQDIHEGDVIAWPTNLGWMMGPWLIYASLLNGAAMALYDDAPTTAGFIRFVEDAGVTMLGVVPSIVAAWRASGVLQRGDWTSVRVLSSTGEASNPDDYRWLMEIAGGIPLIEYCGGTEIGGGYVTSTVLHPAVPGQFSTPALGLDLVLIDEDGRLGDQGEVFLVPPSVGLSTELINRDHDAVYYSDLPDIGRPLRRHGDQMVRLESGNLRALGRVDDTMNLGGIKISSAELEGAIEGVQGVSEAAAVAIPPTAGGPDRLVVFVVPVDDTINADALKTEMQRLIRSRLNPLFKIHEVVLIDALPRTASHKVMRRTLRAGFSAEDTSR
jgi:acetyl-CoA synthetase